MIPLLLLFVALAHFPANAQQAASPETPVVRVGVYVSPPFVMEMNGQYTGMAVELWEKLANRLKFRFQYEKFPTFGALIDATATGKIDVAVTNLTVTRGRAQRIDFTQPWFDAGLRLLVAQNSQAGFWDIVTELGRSGHLRAYGWLAFVIVIASLLLTLFDRKFDKDFPSTWRDGLAESFYAVMSVATSGQVPSRKNLFGWIGRVMQALWLVCGVAVLAYVTSSVTSVMTTLSLTNQINGVADLPGKTVGVFTGSVAEEYTRGAGLRFHSYKNVDEAVAALRARNIHAIIGDAPVLEYFAIKHPDAAVAVVGPIFEPDKYAFGLAQRSPWTKSLTLEVLGAHESDLVDSLRTRYFGPKQ